jgi:hypothetical protein
MTDNFTPPQTRSAIANEVRTVRSNRRGSYRSNDFNTDQVDRTSFPGAHSAGDESAVSPYEANGGTTFTSARQLRLDNIRSARLLTQRVSSETKWTNQQSAADMSRWIALSASTRSRKVNNQETVTGKFANFDAEAVAKEFVFEEGIQKLREEFNFLNSTSWMFHNSERS